MTHWDPEDLWAKKKCTHAEGWNKYLSEKAKNWVYMTTYWRKILLRGTQVWCEELVFQTDLQNKNVWVNEFAQSQVTPQLMQQRLHRFLTKWALTRRVRSNNWRSHTFLRATPILLCRGGFSSDYTVHSCHSEVRFLVNMSTPLCVLRIKTPNDFFFFSNSSVTRKGPALRKATQDPVKQNRNWL